MASYNELLALIDAYINRNGVQAITGQILNGVLKAMVDQLGRGYTLMGYAEPTGDPGTPDGPESWFASVPGTYTNYGEIQVAAGELALLSFAPSEGWTKNTIYEGFREVTATADDNIGFPQVGVTYANGVLSFDFKNIKGEPGENGDPAGFGSVTASVDDQVGTPSVSVSSSGPDTAKNFAFAFHNLKGETGVTSVVATVDNTSGNPQCSVSLQGGQLTLAFTGLKGAQGNTGSSVDYPFTIVNNLTTDDPTQALSAAMGVELDGKVSQLEAELYGGTATQTKDASEIWEKRTDTVVKSDNSGLGSNSSYDAYVLDCSGYSRIYGIASAYLGSPLVAFYSGTPSSSTFISRINATVSKTDEAFDSAIPEGATVVAINGAHDASTPSATLSKTITIGGELPNLQNQIDALDTRVDNLPTYTIDDRLDDASTNPVQNKAIKDYVDTITGFPYNILPAKWTGHSLLAADGTAVDGVYLTSRGVTDYLPVIPGRTVHIKSGVWQGSSTYCYVAFYADKDETTFISSLIGSVSTDIEDVDITVPALAYYCRFVLKDYTVPAVVGLEKNISDQIDELRASSAHNIAKNYGKSVVVFGGSHTALPNSETAKNIWRDKLGMTVYTAGVGSTGILYGLTMDGWTFNGVSYYTREGFADGVGTRVWDDDGYLSNLTITAKTESAITLSDGNTYARDTTKDYFRNAQTEVARLVSKSAMDKDIYIVWLSTNDYAYANSCPIGTFTDYTETDNYDTTKIYVDSSHKGTVCGGFNYIVKTIRDNNPTAEIYVFSSLRFFNNGQKGYNPYTTDVNASGLNFYEYQLPVLKAAQVAGCAILDQFLLQGIGIDNYTSFYESDQLHLKVAGYERIGYIQADFLANGK